MAQMRCSASLTRVRQADALPFLRQDVRLTSVEGVMPDTTWVMRKSLRTVVSFSLYCAGAMSSTMRYLCKS